MDGGRRGGWWAWAPGLAVGWLLVAACGRHDGEVSSGASAAGDAAAVVPRAAVGVGGLVGVLASPLFGQVPPDACVAVALRPAAMAALVGGDSRFRQVEAGFAARWGVSLTGGATWEAAGLNPAGVLAVALREGPRRDVMMVAELAELPAGERRARVVAWLTRLASAAVPPVPLRWEAAGNVLRAALPGGLSVEVGDAWVRIGPAGWQAGAGGLGADARLVRLAGRFAADSGVLWARQDCLPWPLPFARGVDVGAPVVVGWTVSEGGVAVQGRVPLAREAVGADGLAAADVGAMLEAALGVRGVGALSVGVARGRLGAVLAEVMGGDERAREVSEALAQRVGVDAGSVMAKGFGGAVGVGLGVEEGDVSATSVVIAGLAEADARGIVTRLGDRGDTGWRGDVAPGTLRLAVEDGSAEAADEAVARLRADWRRVSGLAGPGLVGGLAASPELLKALFGGRARRLSAVLALRRGLGVLEVFGYLRASDSGGFAGLLLGDDAPVGPGEERP